MDIVQQVDTTIASLRSNVGTFLDAMNKLNLTGDTSVEEFTQNFNAYTIKNLDRVQALLLELKNVTNKIPTSPEVAQIQDTINNLMKQVVIQSEELKIPSST